MQSNYFFVRSLNLNHVHIWLHLTLSELSELLVNYRPLDGARAQSDAPQQKFRPVGGAARWPNVQTSATEMFHTENRVCEIALPRIPLHILHNATPRWYFNSIHWQIMLRDGTRQKWTIPPTARRPDQRDASLSLTRQMSLKKTCLHLTTPPPPFKCTFFLLPCNLFIASGKDGQKLRYVHFQMRRKMYEKKFAFDSFSSPKLSIIHLLYFNIFN
jgi:hypothetical protein